MNSIPQRKKGKETRASILQAATDLLLEEGYGNFVFRGVAKRARIEPGNVQYYFATKRDLLWAVLEPELENYLQQLEVQLRKGKSRSQKIDGMVRYLISDITKEKTLRLWLSIWGIAAHDPELSEMLSDWYRTYVDSLSRLLREVFPSLDKEQSLEAAASITAYFDGLLVLLQIGKPRRKTVAGIRRNIDAIVMRIINPEDPI